MHNRFFQQCIPKISNEFIRVILNMDIMRMKYGSKQFLKWGFQSRKISNIFSMILPRPHCRKFDRCKPNSIGLHILGKIMQIY